MIRQNADIRNLIVNQDALDEILLCGICQEFVIEPKECDQCQHLFCEKCINAWSAKNRICPFKCSADDIVLKNPHRIIKNQIEKTQLRCPNKTKGCQQQISLGELNGHLKQCEYRLVKCRFNECQQFIILINLEEHEKLCNFRYEICQKCDQKYKQISQHDCIVSLKVKILDIEQKTKEKFEELLQRIKQLEDKKFDSSSQFLQPKCNNGHVLQWVPAKSKDCSKCSQHHPFLRYTCKLCDYWLCQNCQKPQFLGQHCFSNHQLVFNPNPAVYLSCDFCQQKISQKQDTCLSDRECDFDICTTCFKKLSR